MNKRINFYVCYGQRRNKNMKKTIGMLSILCLGMCSQSVMALCVGCSCSANSSSLAFGTYNPIANSQINTTGNIAVTCRAVLSLLDAPYTISLSKGNSTLYSPRKMSNGIGTLDYNLYTLPERTQIWGDGTGGTSTVSGQIKFLQLLQNVTVNHTIYGSIPANQTAVKAGNYTDTVIVTISY